MHLCNRSFFYNLLMAPLHTAVSGKQGHDIPIPAIHQLQGSRILQCRRFNTSRTNAQVLFCAICKSACDVSHTQDEVSFFRQKSGGTSKSNVDIGG